MTRAIFEKEERHRYEGMKNEGRGNETKLYESSKWRGQRDRFIIESPMTDSKTPPFHALQ